MLYFVELTFYHGACFGGIVPVFITGGGEEYLTSVIETIDSLLRRRQFSSFGFLDETKVHTGHAKFTRRRTHNARKLMLQGGFIAGFKSLTPATRMGK